MTSMNNYEKTYRSLVPQLAGLNVSEVSKAGYLGLDKVVDGQIELELLRRRYAIDCEGVYDLGGEGHENVNCKSVLIYYLTYGGSAEPTYRFLQLHDMSQGLFSDNSTFSRHTDTKLGALFADEPERFTQAMRLLGATPVEARSGSDATWRMLALPKIPFEFRYYHEDEEFPCTIRIFVDETALDYLPFETLAVFIGCVRGELEHLARHP